MHAAAYLWLCSRDLPEEERGGGRVRRDESARRESARRERGGTPEGEESLPPVACLLAAELRPTSLVHRRRRDEDDLGSARSVIRSNEVDQLAKVGLVLGNWDVLGRGGAVRQRSVVGPEEYRQNVPPVRRASRSEVRGDFMNQLRRPPGVVTRVAPVHDIDLALVRVVDGGRPARMLRRESLLSDAIAEQHDLRPSHRHGLFFALPRVGCRTQRPPFRGHPQDAAANIITPGGAPFCVSTRLFSAALARSSGWDLRVPSWDPTSDFSLKSCPLPKNGRRHHSFRRWGSPRGEGKAPGGGDGSIGGRGSKGVSGRGRKTLRSTR